MRFPKNASWRRAVGSVVAALAVIAIATGTPTDATASPDGPGSISAAGQNGWTTPAPNNARGDYSRAPVYVQPRAVAPAAPAAPRYVPAPRYVQRAPVAPTWGAAPARPAPPTMIPASGVQYIPANRGVVGAPPAPQPPAAPVNTDLRNWSTPSAPLPPGSAVRSGPPVGQGLNATPIVCPAPHADGAQSVQCYRFDPAPTRVIQQPVCPPAQPQCLPACREWSGCGLACADGLSQWHIRGVVGQVFFEGTDAPDSCDYAGIDIGRTFCGCWGVDVFYRWHSGQLDRLQNGMVMRDGSEFPDGFHHVGVKLTYESAIGNSKWFLWGGAGPEYFWTEGYINNDSGFGVYGEAGIGYVFNRNFRVRGGVNVHGFDTDVTRLNPADDGDSRWLWAIAPVIQLEVNF